MQGEIYFITSALKRGAQQRLGDYMNFGKDDLPLMVAVQQKEQLLKFKYEADIQEMTADDVSKFVKDFKNGTLKPHLKSEKKPKEQTVDGLTTIVSNTWD